MPRINFINPDITTTYIGRNGTGKCIGLDITERIKAKGDGVGVTIAPINSKGKVANCNIDIPIQDIEAFVAELIKIAGIVTFTLGDLGIAPAELVVGATVDVTAKPGDTWTGVIYHADVTKVNGNIITIEYSNESEGDVSWEVDSDQCKICE